MKYIYIICFVLTVFFVGCTDDFAEFNTDKKNPANVAGNSLFTNGSKELADQINSTNVNQNIFKMVAQYWTETTYTDEANYLIVERGIPEQIYRNYYREGLKDIDEAARLIAEETGPEAEATKANRLAIIEIVKAYSYNRLVDIFGMIIYSEALNIGNVYPKYDDGATIYADLINKIDAAINTLDVNEDSFGSADLIYGGDVASWKMFAQTLKIKLGISIADANATLAKSTIESALAGAFTSSSDDALMPYQTSSPNQNPLYEDLVATGRKDFVPANTIVDIMNTLDDPRRQFYFTQFNGGYLGGIYGFPNSYLNYSHIDPAIEAPDYPGPFLTYTEMLFYLAEAAERGITVSNTAEEYYNMGIQESILNWGGDAADVTAYLAQTDIAYTTAPDASADGWREKIGTQSWLANYTRGLEAWTTWRRLDYPVFNVAELVNSTADIPTRFTFPAQEQTLNPDRWAEAAAAVGGDTQTTKIFWDIYDVN
jgi:SusD/RagB-like outer membrane lipoprotein